MLKNRSNGKPIHTNVLAKSHPDTILLCQAVHERFIDVLGMWLRIKFEPIVPPEYLNKDIFLWRTMRARFAAGDYRNTADEWKSVKRVADWTMQIKCKLTDTKYVPIEWAD